MEIQKQTAHDKIRTYHLHRAEGSVKASRVSKTQERRPHSKPETTVCLPCRRGPSRGRALGQETELQRRKATDSRNAQGRETEGNKL
jgi:hypothetical protein